MQVTTTYCDRCGRKIDQRVVLQITIDTPTVVSGQYTKIKEACKMDVCLYCFHDITGIPIDDFI